MIFATVGTQLPFDRLIRYLDELAGARCLEILAQAGRSAFQPKHLKMCAELPKSEFGRVFEMADVIVSHAGVGSVLAARRYKKPIIIVPRLAALGEHRNDHQIATAKALEGTQGVYVARELAEIEALLDLDELQGADDHVGPSYSRLLSRLNCELLRT